MHFRSKTERRYKFVNKPYAEPERTESGKFVGFIAAILNITERKREAEEASRMATVVRDSNDAITIQDFAGRITAWNHGAELIYGYSEAEALQMNIERLTAPGKIQEQKDFVRRLLAGEAVTSLETQRVTKDGRVLDVWMTVTKLVDDADEPIGIASTERDITERKQAEAKLKDALVHAEAGNLAKSEFLSIMSHELRTPLNGVLGFAELLTLTPLAQEQESLVETISKCGQHLLAIVNDILDFSSMEAGNLSIEVAPMTVAEVVEQSALAIQKSAAEKALAYRCETSRDAPQQITGDELRIRQILINLLGNAIKFTSSGSVVLRVAPSAEGRFLNFSVEDTGIGISPEALGLLFKPFTQVDSTMSRAFQGSGLGLAISKRLAEAMGGSITVASIPEKGSTFTFHFPLESAPVCADGITTVSSTVSDGGRGTKTSVTDSTRTSAQTEPPPYPVQTGGIPPEYKLVLVVEDDPVNSLLVGKMLQSLGYCAEFAADGAEAVKAFEPGKYFAILMDLVMPRLNGVEATKKIRQAESGSRVPITALTANVTPADRELCLAAGMNDFLSKPFTRAALASALASVTQNPSPTE